MQPSKNLRAFLCALLCALCAFASNASAARPNVLLLCVDDLKPALGCYGDALAKSPNLDRLAARGVRFDRAYCNQAVCSPSRNALMAGLRPQTLGIYDLPTHFRKAAPDAVTVGQYFKRHGYRTEGLGKIFHVGHGNIDDADSWSVPSWRPKGGGYALKESTEGARESNTGPKGAAYESADVPDNQYADGLIAEEAIVRLRAAKERKDQPFFLAVGFLKPHLPFVAPKKYWDRMTATVSNSRNRRRRPPARPATRRSPAASCATTRTCPPAAGCPTTFSARSSTATTRRRVTWTRRPAACSMN
jgi:iduronate 2-sulfatase